MLIQIEDPNSSTDRLKCIGIDFGTTHCVAAVQIGDKIKILEHHGQTLIPSVVSWNGEPIASIKREIGQKSEKAEEILEMCVLLLRSVQEHIVCALGYCPLNAVITIPAYFDDVQRSVVKTAAEKVGFNVMRLLTEPTAAAIAYGVQNQAAGLYAVYDWGGGTFDFSLLKMEAGLFQVLATGGDNALGGNDIDQSIVDWGYARNLTLTLAQAREFKENLTHQEEVNLCKEQFFTKKCLHDLTNPFLERSLQIVRSVLKEAGVSFEQVKGLIFAGGTTKMPYIRENVESLFSLSGCLGVNPDECVAAGAAVHANNLADDASFLLLDITPLSLGIETWGGLVERLIPKHSPLPAIASQVFTTAQDGQTKMKVHVVQGEREFAADCRSLGYFEFSDIPSLPKGMGRVKIEFRLDVNGLLTVFMTELDSQNQKKECLETTKGLDLKSMNQNTFAEEIESGDEILKRLWIQKSQMAQDALDESNRLMTQYAHLFSQDEVMEWKNQCQQLKDTLTTEDFLLLREKMDLFLEYLQPMIEKFLTWSLSKHVQKDKEY